MDESKLYFYPVAGRRVRLARGVDLLARSRLHYDLGGPERKVLRELLQILLVLHA